MKFTLDKNFFYVQFTIVIIFYLINSLLLNGKNATSHFTTSSKSKKIESSDLLLYVLAQQYGTPGNNLTPISNEAITVASVQKIMFVAYATGALVFSRSNTEFGLFSSSK
jgi:hypothetical protein